MVRTQPTLPPEQLHQGRFKSVDAFPMCNESLQEHATSPDRYWCCCEPPVAWVPSSCLWKPHLNLVLSIRRTCDHRVSSTQAASGPQSKDCSGFRVPVHALEARRIHCCKLSMPNTQVLPASAIVIAQPTDAGVVPSLQRTIPACQSTQT